MVEKLYETKHWNGEHGDDPIGYSITNTRGKKGDFNKAMTDIQKLLVPGTNHTLENKTLIIKSEEKKPYKKLYEVEIMNGNEVGAVTLQIHGPNSKQVCSIGVDKAKKCDKKIVKIVTETFIKPLQNDAMSGKGWNDLTNAKRSS